MKFHVQSSLLAIALVGLWPSSAQAQASGSVTQEMAQMHADIARMAKRIDELEAALAAARSDADSATKKAGEALVTANKVQAASPVEVTWKGAPQLKGKGGWSFKPRGRLQFDAGSVNAPDATGRSDGFGSEVRRARLGVEGDIPGGFGYKFEVDFADGGAEIVDAVLTYEDGGLKLTAGQHNGFQGLEELTSSRFNTMIERAAFTDAFGFERRLGLSAQYEAGDFLVQGGAFASNINESASKSWSVDGRAVFMPKMGNAQLHLGGSLHYRKLDDAADAVRYRQRPFVHFNDTRFVDTGSIAAESETGYGLEAAAIAGRFHAAGEAFWQKVGRSAGFADPTFFGGYAEVGYFITKGDKRGYKNGIFDRTKPARPVGSGGIGAIEVNLRYDHLDLNDRGIMGGQQRGYALSLIWTPTDYTRFLLNYGRMQYRDAAYPAAGGDTDYGVDAFGMRAQIDF